MTRGKLANGALPVDNALAQRGDDIDVERVAGGARFLGAIEHGQVLDGLGEGGEEMFNRERAIEVDLEHARLFRRARSGIPRFPARLRRPSPS